MLSCFVYLLLILAMLIAVSLYGAPADGAGAHSSDPKALEEELQMLMEENARCAAQISECTAQTHSAPLLQCDLGIEEQRAALLCEQNDMLTDRLALEKEKAEIGRKKVELQLMLLADGFGAGRDNDELAAVKGELAAANDELRRMKRETGSASSLRMEVLKLEDELSGVL